jgi:hypothetical protein
MINLTDRSAYHGVMKHSARPAQVRLVLPIKKTLADLDRFPSPTKKKPSATRTFLHAIRLLFLPQDRDRAHRSPAVPWGGD